MFQNIRILQRLQENSVIFHSRTMDNVLIHVQTTKYCPNRSYQANGVAYDPLVVMICLALRIGDFASILNRLNGRFAPENHVTRSFAPFCLVYFLVGAQYKCMYFKDLKSFTSLNNQLVVFVIEQFSFIFYQEKVWFLLVQYFLPRSAILVHVFERHKEPSLNNQLCL